MARIRDLDRKKWYQEHKEQIKNQPSRSKEYRHKEYLKRKNKSINHSLMTKYGISLDTRELMLQKQDYKCAICLGPFKTSKDTHTDHNHKTNQSRALLCRACNHLIGNCKEDINILVKAIEYLESYSMKAVI